MTSYHHRRGKGTVTRDKIEINTLESVMPSVEELKELENLCPGSIANWQNQTFSETKNRQQNERWLVRGYVIAEILGLLIGFAVAMFFVWVGYQTILLGHAKCGTTIIAGGGIATIILAIKGKRAISGKDK